MDAPPETTANAPAVDVSQYANEHGARNKLGRVAWQLVWLGLFRPSPRVAFGWRRFLLRCFGARIDKGAHVYPTCRVWAPWNLEMGEHACLADDVDCYSVAPVKIGAHATVSQYSFLCTASHDIGDPHMRLTTRPITIGPGAWVCADVFVAPGVTLGEGAVAGARASVFEDVEAWAVVQGNPAKIVKRRVLR